MTPTADDCPPGVPDAMLPAGYKRPPAAAPRWIDPRRVHTGVPMVATHTTTLTGLIGRLAAAIGEMPR